MVETWRKADLLQQRSRVLGIVSSIARRHERRHQHVLEHRALGQQAVILKHEPDLGVPEIGESSRRQREWILSAERDLDRLMAARVRRACRAMSSCRCPTDR
jgi:hypothetical protein